MKICKKNQKKSRKIYKKKQNLNKYNFFYLSPPFYQGKRVIINSEFNQDD